MKNYTYELFNVKRMENGIKKVSCRVYKLNETQIEVFSLIITKENEYQAWTYDTINQETINRRKEIETELNELNKQSKECIA